jgi:Na+/H+ antiporter NhaD/arsenite permease-like protein
MSLLTGNPSNFILTSIFGIKFMDYLRPMILVGLVSGLIVLVYSFLFMKVEVRKETVEYEDLTEPILKPEQIVN